jgi:hypothetical protein
MAEDDGRHHVGPDRCRPTRGSRSGSSSAARSRSATATLCGGWRIIKTLGTGLVEIRTRQGMAAKSSSAAVIPLSSHIGYSLSTANAATASILGSGAGYRRTEVRWVVAGRIALVWLLTLLRPPSWVPRP